MSSGQACAEQRAGEQSGNLVVSRALGMETIVARADAPL
jgi:hypothetical protein